MRNHRSIVLGAALLALALFAGACASGEGDEPTDGSPSAASGSTEPKGSLTVGVSGAFAESQVVAEMYAQVLENAGYTVSRELNIDSRDVGNEALQAGEIDLKPEYLAYELPTLDPEADTSGTPEEVAARLQEAAEANGLTTYAYSPANSTNAFVVTGETAEELGVSTMSDLAGVSGDLVLGGPPDCPKRDFCIKGLSNVYGIEFAEFRPLDFGGPQTVEALRAGAIDVGLLFSLDPTIYEEGWVILEDDQGLQPAGNFVPLVRQEVDSDELRSTLDPVTESLTDEIMLDLVGRIVVDEEDIAEVATSHLENAGLVG
ncbi:MAG TPA: ABC transporter substrate-binding protein [Actinomycetota bacterium]|nr:ABC transporter substrate-binding protein [Actinomycetota bacterium]